MYPVLVPAVDEDGIPEGGMRLPYVAEPLGTYWGWNIREAGYAPGQLCGLTGSFIPFPESETEDDSRRPLQARYADEQEWRAAVQAAAEDLCRAGPDVARRRPAGGGGGRTRPVGLPRLGSSRRFSCGERRFSRQQKSAVFAKRAGSK
jgi:hypothetical protein